MREPGRDEELRMGVGVGVGGKGDTPRPEVSFMTTSSITHLFNKSTGAAKAPKIRLI